MSRWFYAALGCVFFFAIDANGRPQKPLRFARPHHLKLQNGLNVVIEPEHTQPRVALAIRYEVGSSLDPKGYAGLSHLVEHLSFLGSRYSRPHGAFSLLERYGAASLNADTTLDATTYRFVLPAGALELALWLESDRLAFTSAAITAADVKRERSVVRSELNSKGTRYSSLGGSIVTAAFGEKHDYAFRPEGLADLDYIDLNAVRWWYQQHYRPDNASLVLVGDVEPAQVAGLVERYFGSIGNPRTQRQPRPLPVATKLAARKLDYAQHVAIEYSALVWLVPPPTHPSRLALELIRGRLADSVDTATIAVGRIATASKLEFEDYRAGSLFVIRNALASGHTHEECLDAVAQVVTRYSTGELDRDLEDLRGNFIARALLRAQDPLYRADRHLEALSRQGAPYDPAAELRSLESLTVNDVVSAVRHWLNPQSALRVRLMRDDSPYLPPQGHVVISR